MTDVASLLAAAKRPERTVPLCLRGDLQAAFEQLERDLAQAQRTPVTKLTDSDESARIARQIEALRDDMQSATVTFRLRALRRPDWRKLQGEFTREDGSLQAEEFAGPAIRACMVEPELSDEQWSTLTDEVLTDAQYDELFEAVWSLNRRSVDVPFSRAASLITQSSEQS
jgi:hypothetical protein